jgi:hypothetical protein
VNTREPRRASLPRARVVALLALLALLAGCGSGVTGSRARADDHQSCPQAVMATLASVLSRVYREGVHSERTASAEAMIKGSAALRAAIEKNDAPAAQKAVRALLATGHMTDVQITTVSGRRLVDLGGAALAPLHGTIKNASGKPIASYLTSVWSDQGLISESSGVAEGLIVLRAADHNVGGSRALPEGPLPAAGTTTWRGAAYQFSSLPARAYPSGAPVRIYLLRTVAATERLCGANSEDTQVNTLERIANLIYVGERGPRTLSQVHRVQRNQALLQAVARRDPAATKRAAEVLLHHHLVRLRVSAGGKLLYDLGGPFVLAPVHAPLRLHGRQIGSIVISIQDDEGYLRLANRLVGLRVLMYMTGAAGHPRLVKNSLGPGAGKAGPQSVPASGSYSFDGASYRVFTVNAEAFPSGPLTIRVFVPEPYGEG